MITEPAIQESAEHEESPREIARRAKIAALNQRLRQTPHGADRLLSEDADETAIETVEVFLMRDEIRRSTPSDTPDRNRIIEDKIAEQAASRSPLRRLRAMVVRKLDLEGKAALARAEADAELRRIAALQKRYEGLQERLALSKQHLKDATARHESIVAEFEQANTDDALVRRYIDVSSGNKNSLTAFVAASEIIAGTDRLGVAIATWPRVEAVLKHRVEVLEQELSRFEREEAA